MASSNITRVGSASQNVFNRMSQSANQMTGRNRVLGMSFSELQNKIKQVEDTISRSTIPSQIAMARRELASLQRQSANHAGNTNNMPGSSKGIGVGGVALGSMLGGIATAGISMAVGAIQSGVSEIVTQANAKEKAVTGLTTFLGKSGASEAYNNIRKDAAATPYDTASLLEVNRSLISAGLGAKQARTDSMNLANAVAAVGGGNDVLSRMAANMQQIKTVGKATAMDIRQFGIAGINVYEMLARSTGKSIDQVKEMEVSYEDLAKSLAMAGAKGGIYEGALAAQSKTREAKWNTFKESVLNGLVDMYDAFSPIISRVLDIGVAFANNIEPMLQRAKPYIDYLAGQFGKAVDFVRNISKDTGGWADYLAIAEKHFSNVWEFVKKTGAQLWELVSGIIEFVRHSELIKDVFRFSAWYLEKIFHIIGGVLDVILWIWNTVLQPVLGAIDKAYKIVKEYLGFGDKEVKVHKKLTLSTPKPNDPDSPLTGGASAMASNSASGKSAGETVSGAGPKVTNIHVGKFFENLQFTTMNANESVSEMEKVVMECLARIVYNGSKMV
ncbi:tape measure protein [Flavobacterium fluviatile]|uniref:tape measure protein n=1 Tax=Flavobacterium fluviatile TaxID=1862387 RepID=UPI0013D67546|nr:tape measure protein [Flavobacterium fluviatile]